MAGPDFSAPDGGAQASERDFIRANWRPGMITDGELREMTEVRRLDTGQEYDNPFEEAHIGRYRAPESARAATADEDILMEFVDAQRRPPCFLDAGPRQKLRFDPCRVKAAIVAVGGTAPSTNAVIHAIVDRHAQYAKQRAKRTGKPDKHEVLGVKYGFFGMGGPGPAIQPPEPLSVENTATWSDLAGCELGLSRYDFHAPQTRALVAQRLVNELHVEIVYVIGGDGGMRAAAALCDALNAVPGGSTVVVAGIPKTMDNDITWVWQSLGFGTALAEAARILNDLRKDVEANGRVILVELFGADAGFVTALSALASGKADCVLIPEVRVSPQTVADYVVERVGQEDNRKHCALLVMAEGALLNMAGRLNDVGEIQLPSPDPRELSYWRRDARYEALTWMRQAVRQSLKSSDKPRTEVVMSQPGYLIRAVPGCAEDQNYARRLGDLVVDNALAGYTRFVISKWLTEYVLVPLDLVGKVEKRVPPQGIMWREVVASTRQPDLG